MDQYWMPLRELNMMSMVLRVVLAMCIGGIIGLDRELKHQPAGFRTYMLVAVVAAATAILSQYLDLMLDTQWSESLELVGRRTDVVRLGARVVSGIGFIGTGTILITDHREVKGLTTACCLWASGCMGLAIGAGFYECVLVGFVIIVICMRILPLIEDALLARARNMNIFIEMDSVEDLSRVVSHMKAEGIRLYDVEMGKEEQAGVKHVTGLFSIRLPERRQHADVLADLSTLDGVAAIEEM